MAAPTCTQLHTFETEQSSFPFSSRRFLFTFPFSFPSLQKAHPPCAARHPNSPLKVVAGVERQLAAVQRKPSSYKVVSCQNAAQMSLLRTKKPFNAFLFMALVLNRERNTANQKPGPSLTPVRQVSADLGFALGIVLEPNAHWHSTTCSQGASNITCMHTLEGYLFAGQGVVIIQLPPPRAR